MVNDAEFWICWNWWVRQSVAWFSDLNSAILVGAFFTLLAIFEPSISTFETPWIVLPYLSIQYIDSFETKMLVAFKNFILLRKLRFQTFQKAIFHSEKPLFILQLQGFDVTDSFRPFLRVGWDWFPDLGRCLVDIKSEQTCRCSR